jgi:hypothetical protein
MFHSSATPSQLKCHSSDQPTGYSCPLAIHVPSQIKCHSMAIHVHWQFMFPAKSSATPWLFMSTGYSCSQPNQVPLHAGSVICSSASAALILLLHLLPLSFLFSVTAVVYAVAGTLRVLHLRMGHGEIFKILLPSVYGECFSLDSSS